MRGKLTSCKLTRVKLTRGILNSHPRGLHPRHIRTSGSRTALRWSSGVRSQASGSKSHCGCGRCRHTYALKTSSFLDHTNSRGRGAKMQKLHSKKSGPNFTNRSRNFSKWQTTLKLRLRKIDVSARTRLVCRPGLGPWVRLPGSQDSVAKSRSPVCVSRSVASRQYDVVFFYTWRQ